MSSDEDEYDIMAARRKSTLKSGVRIPNIFENEPSSAPDIIVDNFLPNFNTRPNVLDDSEDNSDSDNETKPTANFFDDLIEKKDSFLDQTLELMNRKNTPEIQDSPSLSACILLGTSFNSENKDVVQESDSIAPEPRLFNFLEQKSDTLECNVSQDSEIKSSKILLNNVYSSRNDEQKKKIIEENLNLKTKLSRTSVDLKLINEKLDDKPDIKYTIDRFLLNKTFWFDLYKTKRDKVNLLSEAIKSNDGNAILAVVLFLKRTLSSQIFFDLLIQNPIALNQYSFYLKQIKDKDQLVALEKFQENYTEIATILSFESILCNPNIELSQKLKLFYDFERSFSLNEINQIKSSRVYEAALKHLTLLKIQKEILQNRSTLSTAQDETKQMDLDHLYENSVWNSLSFCLKYKQDLQINQLYSMEHFKQEFVLTDKEFAIFFIKSMSETGQWTEIAKFLSSSKSLFNIIQKQNVRYETIVSIIHYSNGPEDQIKKYLAMIEDPEFKKLLALKLKAYDIVIDVYRQQKDRIGLYMILSNLKKDSIEYKKASELLQDDKIKWKN